MTTASRVRCLTAVAMLQLWLCQSVASRFLHQTADVAAIARSTISGSDILCGQATSAGQNSTTCRTCGDLNAIISSCQSYPDCVAFAYDGSCGLLKRSAGPTTPREGFTVFVLTERGSGSPVGTALPPATTTPQVASPVASPVSVASPAMNPAGSTSQTPSVAPLASPSPADASAQPAPASGPASRCTDITELTSTVRFLIGDNPDVQLPGYGTVKDSAEDCRTWCQSDSRCKRFVYNNKDNKCFRATSSYVAAVAISGESDGATWTSGLCGIDISESDYSFCTAAIDYAGTDVRFFAGTIQDCVPACKRESQCTFFVHRSSLGCFLKKDFNKGLDGITGFLADVDMACVK